MIDILNKIKDIKAEGCVTLIMNTHRTSPDNNQDPITLKNLLKEAEEGLLKEFDKRKAGVIFENLNAAAEKVDHAYNKESLLVFANEDIKDFVRLPIDVENRVIIDDNFATRDIIRALHEQKNYYVLVLSRKNARLIEGFNNKLVKEFHTDEFPYENDTHYSTDKHQLSTNKGTDNQYEEFFNRVDKEFQAVTGSRKLPLILATEERNFHHYKKVCDTPEQIAGHINMNRDDEKAEDIVRVAWNVVKKVVEEKNAKRISELKEAVNKGTFLSDFNDIWKAVNEGRAQTLFVKRGLFQPAEIKGDSIELSDDASKRNKGVIDDIVDEIIERNISKGGDTVFVEGDELSEFNGIGLQTRY